MNKLLTFALIQFLTMSVILAQVPEQKSKLDQKIDSLIGQMTLEEKASLCSGRDAWSTKPIKRLHIPWIWMSDGPQGLRRAPATDKGGYGDQLPATCFPTASAMAATWNVNLINKVGKALGDECQALDVNIILGPGVNIKRSPLDGRNFEYFSEDPILAGDMGAAMINGVQSQGVGVSLKHFAMNNEEYKRMLTSSQVDLRTMHELYLVPFEIAIKKAHPWTVMACYNRVNGVYGTQNKYLLTDVLRKQFGFKGMVISDWFSVVDRVAGIKAGMNLEMPSSNGYNDALIVKAVKDGKLEEKTLDNNVRDVLRIVFKAKSLQKYGVKLKVKQDHRLAREAADEAITLLKNDDHLLPVTRKYKTIAIIGEFARVPRFEGVGSSEVKPAMLDTAYNEIVKLAGKDYKILYAPGYNLKDDNDLSEIGKAKEVAKKADIAIIFAGLPSHYESEGIDRKNIDMPVSHNKLISEVASVQPNTAVFLSNGSAVAMPWHNKVKAIVETWLGGQAVGGADADVLFGVVNPSGKLAETFPVRLGDTPAFLNFPGDNREVIYGERMFVGYRYYDARKIKPLFPFGYGLSYTTFDYSDLNLSSSKITYKDSLIVTARIKNTGKMAGKEVVELYVAPIQPPILRPVKELKKFTKVSLGPGETKEVVFVLGARDFSYYDARRNMWIAASGNYNIEVGSSSRDIKLHQIIALHSTQNVPLDFDEYTYFSECLSNPRTHALTLQYFKDWIMKFAHPGQTADQVNVNGFFADMPLAKFPYITDGLVTKEKIEEFLKKANTLDR